MKKNDKGFSILGVILVIVVIIVTIGVWALSGQANTNSSQSSTGDVLASALLNDSSTIKLEFDKKVINTISPTAITFIPGVADVNNIYDTANGIALTKASANAINQDALDPKGFWIYQKNFKAAGMGTTAADFAVVMTGIKDSVCKKVNGSINGSETIPSYTGITSSSALVGGATAANPNSNTAVDFEANGLTGINWQYGCVSAGGKADQNMFFRVLKIN